MIGSFVDLLCFVFSSKPIEIYSLVFCFSNLLAVHKSIKGRSCLPLLKYFFIYDLLKNIRSALASFTPCFVLLLCKKGGNLNYVFGRKKTAQRYHLRSQGKGVSLLSIRLTSQKTKQDALSERTTLQGFRGEDLLSQPHQTSREPRDF